MSRVPAPKLNPSDKGMYANKDFFDYIHKVLPDAANAGVNAAAALEAAEDAQQTADEANATAGTALGTVEVVADAVEVAQDDIDALEAAVAALLPAQSTLYFGCQPPGTTANFTGRMFPGHESAQPITTVGAYPSIIVPYNCTIDRMYANVEANVSGGDTDPYTFTLWTTETGSWAASPLTCNVAGNSAGAVSSDLANSIDLDAGDRIAVQITTVAAVGSTGAGHMQVSFRMRPR